MMDDENLEENGPAAVWGGLIALALMGSCANMPYYQRQYEAAKSGPQRIERRVSVSTNQVQYVVQSLKIRVR